MSEPVPRAVFLSYASQDAPAAAAIAAALRADGVEVWFDQDELRGGDVWDAKIKKQIRECALFVPIISANTQARPEGYFRLEWHLAEQRSLLIARGRPFVVPVCLDQTTEGDALVPEAFLAVQWTRLPNGMTTPAFVAQVKRLLGGGATPVGSGSAARRGGSVPPTGQPREHADAPVIPDYELLRQIGRGAYGDVWLARGLTGAYRAIKIVWRDRFDDPAPYHREFRGVKEAMTISLEAGQLPLLHIGQDEVAGYFYYVMELADDVKSGRVVDPERYAPLTLKELKARNGRLPAAQCLEFAEILAQALAALHTRGLVHRDIKPSNVVIVSGRPTLADIGLLASAGEAKTYVGTQGYLAPEGPGSAGGDVFALGRLLYELATGFDREQFPRLPAGITDRAERRTLFELNEILLRAGEPLAQNRYPDATAMLADLRARRSRGINRRRWWRGLGVAVVVALAGFVASQWRGPETALAPLIAAPPPASALPAAPPNSIALLPFENLSDDPANSYFASGLQEDLLTNLAAISALKVAPRKSTESYRGTAKSMKQVGAELGVRYILSGSIRREGQVVVVTAQLINAQNDEQIWAKRFERQLSQALSLQAALADEIINSIQPTLTPGEKTAVTRQVTSSAAAYDLYLKASLWFQGKTQGPDDHLETERQLRQAVALDPGFVRAWVALAGLHRQFYRLKADPTDARIVMAEQAIAEAARLAPDDPEVIMGQGKIRYDCYKDYDGAVALYRKVLASHPNYPEAHEYLAYVYRRLGRWGEMMDEFRAALSNAPGDAVMARRYLGELLRARRLKETAAFIRDLQRYWPDDRDMGYDAAKASFYVSDGSDAGLERWYATIPATERDSENIVGKRFEWAIVTGNEPMLLELIRSHGISRNLDAASLLLFRNEQELLRKSLEEYKPELDEWLRRQPQFFGVWVAQAKYQALQGNRTEAMAAISRARQLMPEAGDAANGVSIAVELTAVLAWLDEKDAAIAECERLVKIPGGFYVIDFQRCIPFRPLRDDPRIRALIADPKNQEPLF